ncbi:MAG: hypothetical protein QXW80_06280 [Candidatus Micrarchaeia archaeon]
MPAQLTFPPRGFEGIRVAYEKFYPFNPIQNPNAPIIDIFNLTSQESGVFYWVLYYYATNLSKNYAINLWTFNQYYPPGSTNYTTITGLSDYQDFAQMGAKLSNQILNNELNCYATSDSTICKTFNTCMPPSSNSNVKYIYVCYYKYNPEYILFEQEGLFYLPPGQSAWVGVAPGSSGSANTWVTARALTLWEVY